MRSCHANRYSDNFDDDSFDAVDGLRQLHASGFDSYARADPTVTSESSPFIGSISNLIDSISNCLLLNEHS